MGRGPRKSELCPHPLTPIKDHKSRDWGEGMIKTPNIPKETRGCFLRIFRGEPETKSSRFGKSNDYRGPGLERQINCLMSMGNTNLKNVVSQSF